MEIRKLQGKERISSELISLTCFHFKTEDFEKFSKDAEACETDDYGIFSDDGTLMSHFFQHQFEAWFDGEPVLLGGIGGVSTLPEYRGQGDIRSLFQVALMDARANGQVFSSLYPFNHGFYRKFGYETVTMWNGFELEPKNMAGYRFSGTITHYCDGDDLTPYMKVYETFAPHYNLMFRRTEKQMKDHIHGTFYKDRYFCYLLKNEKGPVAYVAFQDERHDPQAQLRVKDIAWTCREGFHGILALLGRFSADYGKIFLQLPTGLPLAGYMKDPYEVKDHASVEHMVRVINTEKVLKLMRKPEGTEFTVEIYGDEILPENNGIFRVTGDEVSVDSMGKPDLRISSHAFSVMASGEALSGLLLRPDIELISNESVLTQVFCEKPRFIQDYF